MLGSVLEQQVRISRRLEGTAPQGVRGTSDSSPRSLRRFSSPMGEDRPQGARPGAAGSVDRWGRKVLRLSRPTDLANPPEQQNDRTERAQRLQ